jgi:hypothetical protein
MNSEEQGQIDEGEQQQQQQEEERRGTVALPSQDVLQLIIKNPALTKKGLEEEYLIVNDPSTPFANIEPGLEEDIREFDDDDIINVVKMNQGFFGNDFEALLERKVAARNADLLRSRAKDHSERVLLVSEHHVHSMVNNEKAGKTGRFSRIRKFMNS